MKVLVTGGRTYNDWRVINTVLDLLPDLLGHDIDELIHGDAPGADRHAGAWARANNRKETACPAQWDVYPDTAGPRRNRLMLELKPDILVVFPGGPGTRHMRMLGIDAGIPVYQVAASGHVVKISR